MPLKIGLGGGGGDHLPGEKTRLKSINLPCLLAQAGEDICSSIPSSSERKWDLQHSISTIELRKGGNKCKRGKSSSRQNRSPTSRTRTDSKSHDTCGPQLC